MCVARYNSRYVLLEQLFYITFLTKRKTTCSVNNKLCSQVLQQSTWLSFCYLHMQGWVYDAKNDAVSNIQELW